MNKPSNPMIIKVKGSMGPIDDFLFEHKYDNVEAINQKSLDFVGVLYIVRDFAVIGTFLLELYKFCKKASEKYEDNSTINLELSINNSIVNINFDNSEEKIKEQLASL